MSTRRNEKDDMTTGEGAMIEPDGSGRERVVDDSTGLDGIEKEDEGVEEGKGDDDGDDIEVLNERTDVSVVRKGNGLKVLEGLDQKKRNICVTLRGEGIDELNEEEEEKGRRARKDYMFSRNGVKEDLRLEEEETEKIMKKVGENVCSESSRGASEGLSRMTDKCSFTEGKEVISLLSTSDESNYEEGELNREETTLLEEINAKGMVVHDQTAAEDDVKNESKVEEENGHESDYADDSKSKGGKNSDVVDDYEHLLGSSFDKEAVREEYIRKVFLNTTVDGNNSKSLSLMKMTVILKCLLQYDKVMKMRDKIKALSGPKDTMNLKRNAKERRVLSRKKTLLKNLRKEDLGIEEHPGASMTTLMNDHWKHCYRYRQMVKNRNMDENIGLNYNLYRVKKDKEAKYKVWNNGLFEMEDMSGEVISVEQAFDVMLDELVSGFSDYDSNKDDDSSDSDSSKSSDFHPAIDMNQTQFGKIISAKYLYITSAVAKVFFNSLSVGAASQDQKRIEDNTMSGLGEPLDEEVITKENDLEVGCHTINYDNNRRTEHLVGIESAVGKNVTDESVRGVPDFILMGHQLTDTHDEHLSENYEGGGVIVMVNWRSREMYIGHVEGDLSSHSSVSSAVLGILSNCIYNNDVKDKNFTGPLGILLHRRFCSMITKNERKNSTDSDAAVIDKLLFKKIFDPIAKALSWATNNLVGTLFEQRLMDDPELETLVEKEFSGRYQSFISSIEHVSNNMKRSLGGNDDEVFDWYKAVQAHVACFVIMLNKDFNMLSKDGKSCFPIPIEPSVESNTMDLTDVPDNNDSLCNSPQDVQSKYSQSSVSSRDSDYLLDISSNNTWPNEGKEKLSSLKVNVEPHLKDVSFNDNTTLMTEPKDSNVGKGSINDEEQIQNTNVKETGDRFGKGQSYMKSSETKKLQQFLYLHGPIGVENTGLLCYAIASVRCFLSLTPVIEDLIMIFKKVFMSEKTVGNVVIQSQDDPSQKIDLSQIPQRDIVQILLPATIAVIDFGYKLFCAHTDRPKSVVEHNQLPKHPSITYSTLEKTLKKLLPAEIMNGTRSQDDAYMFLTNLLDRLREEILGVAPDVELFQRYFLMEIIETRTCQKCGNVTYSSPSTCLEPIQNLSLLEASELNESHFTHQDYLKDDGLIHLSDLFSLTMRNCDTIYNVKEWSCKDRMCSCKDHIRESLVLSGPKLLIMNIKRSKRTKDINKDVDEKLKNSFQKDTRPVFIPPEFDLLTSNYDQGTRKTTSRTKVVKYKFMNAICHSSTSKRNMGHYYVLTKMKRKTKVINICLSDSKVTELSDDENANLLFHDSTIITYKRIDENPTSDVIQGSKTMIYPEVPKHILNDLQKLPEPKMSRRTLRSQTRPSNAVQKNLKQKSIIDFRPLFAKYKNVVSKNVVLNTRKEVKTKGKKISRLSLSAAKKARHEEKSNEVIMRSDSNNNNPKKRNRLPHKAMTPSKKKRMGLNKSKVIEVGLNKDLEAELVSKEMPNQILEMEVTSVNSDGTKDQTEGQCGWKTSHQTVLSQMNGLLTILWDDVSGECLFCGNETTNKISPITCICKECVDSYKIDQEHMKNFYEENKCKSTSMLTNCTSCSKQIFENVQPYHELGQFLYCRECIIGKQCNCIVCKSNDNIQKSVRSWRRGIDNRPLPDQSSPVDKFTTLNRLSQMELDMLARLYTKSTSMIVLHFGIYSGNIMDVRSLLNRRSVPDVRHSMSNYMGRSFDGKGNETIDIILMFYYTRIMTHDTEKLIFTVAEEYKGAVFREKFQHFINQCFFFFSAQKNGIKNGIFHKDEIFMLIALDNRGEDWLLLCLKKEIGSEWTLYFYSTTKETKTTDKLIKEINNSLSAEWQKIMENTDGDTTKKFVLKIINVRSMKDNEQCSLNSPEVLSNKSLLAILLLRDWVYGQMSTLSEDSLDNLMLFFILSSLFQTPNYVDYS